MDEEISRTRGKIEKFLGLTFFILSTFFWAYLWPTLRIFDDGLRSGQLRGYVSINSISNGFVSWYTGGPPFFPFLYALQNILCPTLAVIMFLLSLAMILVTTSSVKSFKSAHETKLYIVCMLLSVVLLIPYFLGAPQIMAKHSIEQSPNSSLSVNLVLNARCHVSALLFRNGSDGELKRGMDYFGINLVGTDMPLTYSDAFRIIAEGSPVYAKLQLINSTNIARLDHLLIQFDNDASSKIVITKENTVIKGGSFHLIPADTTSHLVVSQEVNTTEEEPSLVTVKILFSQDWSSRIIVIQIA